VCVRAYQKKVAALLALLACTPLSRASESDDRAAPTHWEVFTTGDGFEAASVVSAIAIDADKREVWLGTLGRGLYRFSGGRFDRFDQLNSGLAGDVVYAVALHDGRVWAATNGGVSSFDPRNATWYLCGERAHDRPDQVVVAFRTEGDDLLAELWQGGTARIARGNRDEPGALHIETGADKSSDADRGDTEWATRTLHTVGLDGKIRCAASRDGDFWIGTTQGLVHGCSDARRLWLAERDAPPPVKPGAKRVSVRIGVLAPSNPLMALPSASVAEERSAVDVPAVLLAVEDANARGGYHGETPFELVHDLHGYARYGWTLPEDDLATLAFEKNVCGVVAALAPRDRAMAVLAERTKVPVVNTQPPSFAVSWIIPLPEESRDKPGVAFEARYLDRFRREPPPDAHRSYRAARLLLQAIESGGLEPESIATRLRALTAESPAP